MCVENSGYWIPDCENYVMILLNISRPSSQHSLNTHPPTSQHSMERFSSPLSDVGSFWCVFCVKTSPHWHDATQKGRWWEAWFGRCSQPRKWTVFVSFSLYILLTPILPLKASICRLKPPVIGEFEEFLWSGSSMHENTFVFVFGTCLHLLSMKATHGNRFSCMEGRYARKLS